MTGHYDRYGKLCTRVFETKRTMIINKSPLEVLDYSIKCIGFDLRGALKTSRWHLGDIHMYPIMVNPIRRIILFPSRSPKHEENIWFNPQHIKRTTSSNRNTSIQFSNGSTLIIPTRLASFNHKLQTAEQLEKMTIGENEKSFTFILNPEKKRGVWVKVVKRKMHKKQDK